MATLVFSLLPTPVGAATLTVLDVTATTYNTSVETTWAFAFTAITSVASTGNVHVVFPSGFVVGATATCRLDGTALTTVVTPSTDVVCSLTGASLTGGTAYTLTIDKVTNPTAAGTTGSFTFQTRNLLNAVQDDHTTNTEAIVTSALTGVDVTAGTYNTGTTTTWTFAFTTVDAVPATGNLRLVFPAGFVATSGVSVCSVGGTALGTTVTGSTEVACALTSQLAAATAYTATVTNVVNPGTVQTTGAFTIQTRTTGNNLINQHTTNTESIVASTLSSVSGSGLVATTGTVTDWTFTFTTVTALVTDDQLRVVFPADFATSSGAATTCDVTAPAAVTSETVEVVSSSEALCKLTAITGGTVAGGTAVTVKFTNIKNPTTERTTGAFTIQTRTSAGVVRDQHTTHTSSIVPSALGLGSVTGASTAAGATTTWTFPITTVNAVAGTGNLRVVFPTGYVVTQGTTTCAQGGTSVTATVTGNDVVCGLASALSAATAYSFDVGAVRNPTVSQTTPAFTVQTRDASNTVHDQHTSNTEAITANTLASVSASGATQKTGATETWTIAFTTVNPVATGGDVRIVWPTGFVVASGTTTCALGATSLSPTVVSATELVCALGSNTLAAATAYTLTLAGVKNPTTAQTTGAFTIQTRSSAAATHDQHTSNTEAITASALTGVAASAPLQTANTAETWTFLFTTLNAVAGGGDVRIVFPTGFQTSSGAATVCDVVGVSGETTTVASATEVVCTFGGTGLSAGASATLTLTNVRNPTAAGTTGAFTIQTRSSTAAVHDEHATNVEGITGAALSTVGFSAPLQTAGATETWTVVFTAGETIAANGDVRIVFPSGFATSSGSTTVCDVAGKSADTTTVVSATEVVCNLVANTVASGEAVTLTLTNVKNPTTAQTTGAFVLHLRDVGDSVVQAHTSNTEIIRPNTLAGFAWGGSSQYAGRTDTWTLTFQTVNAVAASGDIRVQFPPGFQTSSGSATTCDIASKSGEVTVVATLSEVVCGLGTNTLTAGEAVSVSFTNIRNPSAPQTTAPFVVQTRDASDVVHDEHVTNTEAIVSAGLSSAGFSAPLRSAGAVETWTLIFSPGSSMEAFGSLRVVFPAGFTTSADGATVCDVAGKTGETTSVVSPTEVICHFKEGLLAAGESVTVGFSNVQNPKPAGSAGNALVQLRDASSFIREESTLGLGTIVAHALRSGPTVSATSVQAGEPVELTFALTNFNAWPASGRLQIILPSGFVVDGNGPTVVTSSIGPTGVMASPTVSGMTLTFARQGGTEAASSTVMRITVAGLRNPTVTPTGSFTVSLLDGGGGVLDSGTAPGLDLLGAIVAPPTPAPSEPAPVENVTEPSGSPEPVPAPADDVVKIRVGVAPTAPLFAVLLCAALAIRMVRRRGGFEP
ncbi:MAG: hypothetical protein HYT80_02600 [Euryarchaeota archaeon]|nr:hypothetical protein [Euryarchaeota archaeon]